MAPWNSCLLCLENKEPWQRYHSGLCLDCFQKIEPYSSVKKTSVGSLYLYNPYLRRLILQAKLHGTSRTLELLKDLWLERLEKVDFFPAVQGVIPAPSSAWSRLRGRIDLAWLLASWLAQKNHWQLISPPFQLYWRFTKRAKEQNREELYLEELISKKPSKCPTYLIVDDILTTGYTLKRLSQALPASYNLKFITLARSRS